MTEKPLVFSMTSISTFMRCKKKYQIQNELLLDGMRESQALEEGTAFHEIMATYAREGAFPQEESPMLDVARAWLRFNTFPSRIELVEEPVYVQFLPGVFVRCTFDLAYRDEDGNIVIRDWKTFAKWPTLDSDLDFQARLYVACAMRHFKTTKVMFEHVYVRRTPPGIPKDKAGNAWAPEECYLTTPLVVPVREAAQVAKEVQWELANILATRESGQWSRNNLKGGGYDSCASCSVKEICKAELIHGELSDDLLVGISQPNYHALKDIEKIPERLLA